MRSDVRHHCRSCLTCATRKGTGKPSRPPLKAIEVGGPFHRVGVDVLQLPLTENGNRHVVVFQDYLTKWVEQRRPLHNYLWKKSFADMVPQSIYFPIVAQISYPVFNKKFAILC